MLSNRFVYATDLHLSDNRLATRSDDWPEVGLEKLRQIVNLANSHGGVLALGGDLFHEGWKVSNSYVNRVDEILSKLKKLPCPFCIGNHDMKATRHRGTNSVFIGYSPIKTLERTGVIAILPENTTIPLHGINWRATHYRQIQDPYLWIKNIQNWNITHDTVWIMHGDIVPERVVWSHVLMKEIISRIYNKAYKVLFLLGHIHSLQYIQAHSALVKSGCPGSVGRVKKERERVFEPGVFVICYSQYNGFDIKTYPLACNQDPWIRIPEMQNVDIKMNQIIKILRSEKPINILNPKRIFRKWCQRRTDINSDTRKNLYRTGLRFLSKASELNKEVLV